MLTKPVHSEGRLETIYTTSPCVTFKFSKYAVSVCDADLRATVTFWEMIDLIKRFCSMNNKFTATELDSICESNVTNDQLMYNGFQT